MGATEIGGGGGGRCHEGTEGSTKKEEPPQWIKRASRDASRARGNGCKLVNERGFSRVLGLYKVGSEGLTEVLSSTARDQYGSGFPHYWNRPHCVDHRMDCWDPTLLVCVCQPANVFVHNKLPQFRSHSLDYFSSEPPFTGCH